MLLSKCEYSNDYDSVLANSHFMYILIVGQNCLITVTIYHSSHYHSSTCVRVIVLDHS